MMAADPNYYRQHETQQEIEELRGEKMGDSSSKMTGGKKKEGVGWREHEGEILWEEDDSLENQDKREERQKERERCWERGRKERKGVENEPGEVSWRLIITSQVLHQSPGSTCSPPADDNTSISPLPHSVRCVRARAGLTNSRHLIVTGRMDVFRCHYLRSVWFLSVSRLVWTSPVSCFVLDSNSRLVSDLPSVKTLHTWAVYELCI